MVDFTAPGINTLLKSLMFTKYVDKMINTALVLE